jgi:streptomycin 6-kinase
MVEPMRQIPGELSRTMEALHGEAGAEWIERLPEIIERCERQWSLRVGAPFALTYNFVAPAVRGDGTRAVLKLTFPGSHELITESEALRLYAGRGCTQLLELDLKQGGMLLERVSPGTPLGGLPDEEAIGIASAVMRRLWCPVSEIHPFPTVAEWGKGFDRYQRQFGGTSGPLPSLLVQEAQIAFGELESSMGESALLHGDLHYGNILAATREPWLAIDPKGVVGEPEYDTGDFLRNRLDEIFASSHPQQALKRRVDQLATELGFDRERVRLWGFTQAVLSAIWSVEDQTPGWESAISAAELLRLTRD